MKKTNKIKKENKQIVEIHIYVHQYDKLNNRELVSPNIYPYWNNGPICANPCPDGIPGCTVNHI